MRRKTELLAPAGSVEACHAAFIMGADAVYIGGDRFGARAYADNPDQEELLEAIALSHRLGKKLYMTVNTLLKDREIEDELEAWMRPYVEARLDGVIVQDFGVVDLFQRKFPDLPLHASTQMAVTGVYSAEFMKEIGMKRIVPARELSLQEIRRIHESTGMEIEAFAHGAMCYSYSGLCLMSSLIGGRSGNRGRCAGVCRLPFEVLEESGKKIGQDVEPSENLKKMATIRKKIGQDFEPSENLKKMAASRKKIGQDFGHSENPKKRENARKKTGHFQGENSRDRILTGKNSRYPLNMKDMCTIDILPDMIQAGVTSFKIEGRMKKPEYTAGVVQIYRKYLDLAMEDPENYRVDPEDRRALWEIFNRDGFNQGCYLERNGRDLIALKNEKMENVRQKEAQERIEKIRVSLTGKEAEHKLQAPVRGKLYLRVGEPSELTLCWDLMESDENKTSPQSSKSSLSGKNSVSSNNLIIAPNSKIEESDVAENLVTVTVSGQAPQPAEKRPVLEERVREQMNKTGRSPFYFENLDIDMTEGLFVPMTMLNELRREGMDKLSQAISDRYARRNSGYERVNGHSGKNFEIAGSDEISVRNPEMGGTEEFSGKNHEGIGSEETSGEAFRTADAEETTGMDSHEAEKFRFYVSVETPEQLKAVANLEGISGYYIPSDFFENERNNNFDYKGYKGEQRELLGQLAESGREVRLALPHILRDDYADSLKRQIENYTEFADQQGMQRKILVRCLEELGLLREMHLNEEIILDASVYTMNSRAAHFWAAQGYAANTMSLELNAGEMRDRDNRNTEMIVYGRAPMMITAHCLRKTLDKCTHRNDELILVDRKGARFPVQCHCRDCHNVIYNSLPMSLLMEQKGVERTGVRSCRLEFTDESGAEAKNVTDAFLSVWLHGHSAVKLADTTRGHFNRGVE